MAIIGSKTRIEEIVVLECGVCCGPVAMSKSFYESAHGNPDKWFYCLNGHYIHFTKDDISGLRNKAARLEHELNTERQNVKFWGERHKWAEAGRKREKTMRERVEARIKAGVCPHCNRTFQNLRRHMEGKHGNK